MSPKKVHGKLLQEYVSPPAECLMALSIEEDDPARPTGTDCDKLPEIGDKLNEKEKQQLCF